MNDPAVPPKQSVCVVPAASLKVSEVVGHAAKAWPDETKAKKHIMYFFIVSPQ
jgi:hypothetical protein